MDNQSPIKVFICDDSKPARMLLSRMLSEISHDVTVEGESATGRGTVFMLEEDRPDIVMLKLNIPNDADSQEVMQQIRDIHPGFHIILCSLPQDRHLLDGAVRSGLADDFIEKPVRKNVLERSILTYLQKKASEK